MGVSGSGKSTIGKQVSSKLDIPFLEGDHFHSDKNKKKMNAGLPLSDKDRIPWLINLTEIIQNTQSDLLISCSSLKKSYRKILTNHSNRTLFVHLSGSFDLIEKRLREREDHFFNPILLKDQFNTLESLENGENGFEINIRPKIDLVVAEIIASLKVWLV